MVRLVRLQPRQHAVGDGRAGHRPRLVQHHAGGLLGRSGRALLFVHQDQRKWDLALTVNGFLAGLVAITCPCYWVDPEGAFFIGIVAGIVVVWGIDVLEYLRIDDPIGAVPVHVVAGIWGTLSLGLFAAGKYGAPTPTGADTSTVVIGPVLRRRPRRAGGAGDRQLLDHDRDVRRLRWR